MVQDRRWFAKRYHQGKFARGCLVKGCRWQDHASCAPNPRALDKTLFAYTFCKITLCGLHPSHSLVHRVLPPCNPLDVFLALGGQTTLEVSPTSLMYAQLYGTLSSARPCYIFAKKLLLLEDETSTRSFLRENTRDPN